ncbi:MAG TPA: hypothetical protein VGR28_12325, partial [Candidatus Thermoplasmatota archaeon]|nr:hypothetical protein [Candidatus Thermoplasmatota archaeon]
MRALALLLATLMLATALPLSMASPACAPARADRFEPLERVAGLPADWSPLLALDDSRLPAIASVAAQRGDVICSVSGDLPAFVAAAGPFAPADLAALVAATSFVDVVGVGEPLTVDIEGRFAHVQTWSGPDGLVVEWAIDLGALTAQFEVVAVGLGEHVSDLEGWHPWVGFTDRDLAPPALGPLATKVLLAPNADGSQFRITYFTQNYLSEAQADSYAAKYAAAAQAIWSIEVGQWGFTSADADNTYDITADGCSCIFSGNNVNIHIHPKLEDLYTLFSPPLSYPTPDHFYRVVIGHEFHHHLQYSINQWALGSALTEGGARFSETAFEPFGAFGPNTITYLNNANGFSNVMLNPGTPVGSRTYDLGLFWGYLYSQDGLIPLLKRIYQEADVVAGGADGIPNAVSNALAAFPGPHDTFDEAYHDFALQMYKKSFVWGKPDGSEPREWATYLPDVAMTPFQGAGPFADLVNAGV